MSHNRHRVTLEDRANGMGMTQLEVARVFGISRQRVRQIEVRAIQKIKRAARAEAEAAGKTLEEWLSDCV